MYSPEPQDKKRFTHDFDKFYTRFAGTYDILVKALPTWRGWLKQALPYLRGSRVLEVSFGTGYLLTQYAGIFESYGIDYNAAMIHTARRNLAQLELRAELQQADVQYLPYAAESFDTVLNTMAFSGYPDGQRALTEMKRVLRRGGRVVLVDINFPRSGSWLGTRLARMWALAGDVIREMDPLFRAAGMPYREREIGGFGSVHLYVAEKPEPA